MDLGSGNQRPLDFAMWTDFGLNAQSEWKANCRRQQYKSSQTANDSGIATEKEHWIQSFITNQTSYH